MTTVADLITPKTSDQILTELLATLSGQGFPVTAWQSGGAGRTLARADAVAIADLRSLIATICKGGYLDEAEEDWLTLLAAGVFDLDRVPAAFTEGFITATVAGGSGPYTFGAGAFVASDGTRRYVSTNTSSVTLSSASPTQVPVRAESSGDSYNVAGSTVTTLVSPALAGVTVVGASDWITSSGAPAETDTALRARCRSRWATLGRGGTAQAYRYWALNGHAYEGQVTRVAVYPGPGDGTIAVVLADSDGPVSGPIAAAVDAWLALNLPVTDDATATPATGTTVAVVIAATVPAAYNTSAVRGAAATAVATYLNSLAIGGTVDAARIAQVILNAVPQILDLDVTSPAGDVILGGSAVAMADTAGVSAAGNWTSV